MTKVFRFPKVPGKKFTQPAASSVKPATVHPLPNPRPIGAGYACVGIEDKQLSATREVNLGHFLTRDMATRAAEVDVPAASRAVAFWQSYDRYSSDWVKPLLEHPLPVIMDYLHVYHDREGIGPMVSGDASFELATRILEIARAGHLEAAKEIFFAIPNYPGLPRQVRVFSDFETGRYFQAKVVASLDMGIAMKLLEYARKNTMYGDFLVAEILFCQGDFSEKERAALLKTATEYFKRHGGAAKGLELRYRVTWKNKVSHVLKLEEKEEQNDGVSEMWKDLAFEISQEVPRNIYGALKHIAGRSRVKLLARMMEHGYVKEALDIFYEEHNMGFPIYLDLSRRDIFKLSKTTTFRFDGMNNEIQNQKANLASILRDVRSEYIEQVVDSLMPLLSRPRT